jgi:Tol biopolymer transport system component
MRKTSILIVLLLCLPLGIRGVSVQSGYDLFQKALMLERADGRLQEAIALYQRVVNESQDESIAAKAQLQIGICYEKLGQNEARAAYQKVIDNYPQQHQEVASARERMAKLGEEASKPTFRKIQIANQLQLDAQISPDGKSIAFGNNDRLWIAPTSSKVGPGYPGAPKQLDTQGVGAVWLGLAWSGDGQWIAFNGGKRGAEKGFYVVPAAGGKPKWISDPNRDVLYVNYRMSLSPHGETIVFSRVDAGKLYIYKMPVAGGTPQRLVDTPAREPVFSPDGKMIAYTEARNLQQEGGALWIVSSEGKNPILVDDSVSASTPVWSPDGKMLAFVDTAAINKIQIIRLGPAGNPVGEKTSFDCPEAIGQVRRLAGWTPDNKIGAVIRTSLDFALFTQPVDGGIAAYVTHGGYPLYPRWSPDGKRIFHLNNSGFAYVSAEGGEGTTVFHNSEVKMIQGPAEVSHDGLTIAFAGRKEGEPMNIQHIWTRPLDGETPRQLTSGLVLDSYPSWSPDGQKIAFMRSKIPDRNAYMGDIYIVASDGGEIRRLTSESDRAFSAGPVQWSTNGKFLAYFSRPYEDSAVGNLNVMPVNGGEARVVVANIEGVYNHKDIAWSPDSRRIAFNGRGNTIKIVSLDNGSIEEIKPDLKEVKLTYDLDWSPDGKTLVFCGYTGGDPEVWLMEDFLPLVKR